MTEYHIAQLNIGISKSHIDGPAMAGFVSRSCPVRPLNLSQN